MQDLVLIVVELTLPAEVCLGTRKLECLVCTDRSISLETSFREAMR